MQWWRLRSPTIYALQTGDPGKPVVQFDLNVKAWKIWGWRCMFQSGFESPRTRSSDVQGQEKMDVWAQAERENLLLFCLSVLLGSSVDWTMPTHLGEGWSSLLRLPIQVLISSGNILTDTPRNNVLPAFWASQSCQHIKLTLRSLKILGAQ